jgi:hypothetical protein
LGGKLVYEDRIRFFAEDGLDNCVGSKEILPLQSNTALIEEDTSMKSNLEGLQGVSGRIASLPEDGEKIRRRHVLKRTLAGMSLIVLGLLSMAGGLASYGDGYLNHADTAQFALMIGLGLLGIGAVVLSPGLRARLQANPKKHHHRRRMH